MAGNTKRFKRAPNSEFEQKTEPSLSRVEIKFLIALLQRFNFLAQN